MSVAFSRSEAPPAPVRQRSDADLQRAVGEARIAYSAAGGRLRVIDRFEQTPARVLTPRIDGRIGAEVVLLNTSGGVTGGDCVQYGVAAREGAQVLATTQAAEKIYRAIDRDAHLTNRIEASGAGAAVHWLPQPAILFDGARLRRRTEISVADGASALAFDSLVLGREAHGETMRTGAVRDDWRVRRDGRLVWADAFRLTGDIASLTGRAALLGGRRALGALIYVGEGAADLLDHVRALPARDGVLARFGVVAGVLVGRFAAFAADALIAAASDVLAALRARIGAPGAWPPAMWRC